MGQRVTDEEARVFASYREDGPPSGCWYRFPGMLEVREGSTCDESTEMDEFEWLRLLALDLLDARAALLEIRDHDYRGEAMSLVDVVASLRGIASAYLAEKK